jgi:hypothetical protein
LKHIIIGGLNACGYPHVVGRDTSPERTPPHQRCGKEGCSELWPEYVEPRNTQTLDVIGFTVSTGTLLTFIGTGGQLASMSVGEIIVGGAVCVVFFTICALFGIMLSE